MRKLKVTENHLKLLKAAYIDWNDTEFGGPCIDPKRPFGNSEVYGDIVDILGLTMPDEEKEPEKYKRFIDSLDKGYRELEDCLEILCTNLSLEVGYYESDGYKNWRKVE